MQSLSSDTAETAPKSAITTCQWPASCRPGMSCLLLVHWHLVCLLLPLLDQVSGFPEPHSEPEFLVELLWEVYADQQHSRNQSSNGCPEDLFCFRRILHSASTWSLGLTASVMSLGFPNRPLPKLHCQST